MKSHKIRNISSYVIRDNKVQVLELEGESYAYPILCGSGGRYRHWGMQTPLECPKEYRNGGTSYYGTIHGMDRIVIPTCVDDRLVFVIPMLAEAQWFEKDGIWAVRGEDSPFDFMDFEAKSLTSKIPKQTIKQAVFMQAYRYCLRRYHPGSVTIFHDSKRKTTMMWYLDHFSR